LKERRETSPGGRWEVFLNKDSISEVIDREEKKRTLERLVKKWKGGSHTHTVR